VARASEEESSDRREDGVPEVAVERRHRPGPDAAREAVAHHEVVAFAELRDEGHERREVVAVVRVAHHDRVTGFSNT